MTDKQFIFLMDQLLGLAEVASLTLGKKEKKKAKKVVEEMEARIEQYQNDDDLDLRFP